MATKKSTSKRSGGRKYGAGASKSVESAMRRRKRGTLKRGKRGGGTGSAVTSRKQAIAIGLSEAREKGAKVPAAKKGGARKGGAKKSTARKSTARKSTAKRSTATKSTARKSTARKSAGRKSTGRKSAAKRS